MRELYEDAKYFLRKKAFWIPVVLTAFLSYGYLWTHPSMGVDDTCVQRYFADGFAPTQGRWTLFLLNKVFHIAEFSPLVIDFIGVVFLAGAGLIFCILFRRVSKGRLVFGAYPVFVCLMISYPLIAEVYVYYLHNGLGLAHLLMAFALWLLYTGKGWKRFAAASACLAVMASCYESVAAVYLFGILACIMLEIIYGQQEYTFVSYVKKILYCVLPLAVGIIIRSLISQLIMAIMGVDKQIEHTIGGSLAEILQGGLAESLGTMLRTFGRYYVINAIANYAIFLFAVSVAAFCVISVIWLIKTKRWLLVLNGIGILIVPWLLSFMEMTVQPYRTMQVFAFFVAFTGGRLLQGLWNAGKVWKAVAICGIMIVMYNQIFELNQQFYVDYMRYEEDVAVCHQIAYDLQREASLDKPVVFVGKRGENGVVREYAYLDEEDWRYGLIASLRGLLGMGEMEDYSTVQNMVWYSLYDWGVDAFDEAGTEITNFFRYHGYPLIEATSQMQQEAESIARNMSVWPKEGSVLETEEYIIVKLGEIE